MDEMKVFSGNAHPTLAQAVAEYLSIPLGRCEVFEFSNENIFVRILENVRQPRGVVHGIGQVRTHADDEGVALIKDSHSPYLRCLHTSVVTICGLRRPAPGLARILRAGR